MSHYDCPCMEKCPLHYAMSLIGGKWKVQILCSVTNAGTIRYNALRGKLDGISNTVLASALRELERDGLILRRGKFHRGIGDLIIGLCIRPGSQGIGKDLAELLIRGIVDDCLDLL